MNKLSEKVIAGLLLLFLLIYVGYQLYRSYYNPMQLETAFQYSVTHNLAVEGIAIRSETVIDEQGTGFESSVFADGTRVSKGQVVTEFYTTSTGDTQMRRMRELEREIEALEDAQNPSVSNISNSEAINRETKEQLSHLTKMSSTGRFSDGEEASFSLVHSVNKKQVAINKESDYSARIESLRSEYQRLQSGAEAASIQAVATPASGYFVKVVDGLEGLLSPEILGEYTVEEYRTLIEGMPPTTSPNKVGRIVTGVNWYYASLVPKYDVQWMYEGQEVTLFFETVDEPVPGVVEEILAENEEEDAILVVRINYISGELLNLRRTPATISVEQYNGLRISTGSLRFQDDVQGVYILDKKTVRFRRIDPVYEEPGFVVSRENETDAGLVALYDQIITKGLDLYDGKVIE